MTDDSTNTIRVFPVLRATLVLALVVSGVAAAAYYALASLGQPDHARYNVIAAAICGGAGLIGLMPVWLLSRRHPHGAAQGFRRRILRRTKQETRVERGLVQPQAIVLVAPRNGRLVDNVHCLRLRFRYARIAAPTTA